MLRKLGRRRAGGRSLQGTTGGEGDDGDGCDDNGGGNFNIDWCL